MWRCSQVTDRLNHTRWNCYSVNLFPIYFPVFGSCSIEEYWGSTASPSGAKDKKLQTNLKSHLLKFRLQGRLTNWFISARLECLSDITQNICIGSHRQHICSIFAVMMWWAEAACPLISLISALYMSAARFFFERTKSLCDWDFTGKIYFFYRVSFFPYLYKVLCVPEAILGHYISFSMLLHQTMTSPFSNCFQMRQGLSFHSLFHFVDQALAARAQVRADYQTRYMISCRRSTWRKTSCDQVSRKPFIHLPFPLPSFLCSLFSFSLHW